MSVLRQFNWLSQARVDLPHLRAIDASVAGDFDVVVGRLASGGRALVVRGFAMTNTGGAATALQMATADGILCNLEASASGSFLWIPTDRPVETLNPATNSRLFGSWTTGQTNYVGLDFVRQADDSTSDLVQFLDPSTDLETPRQVPLGRTLDYRIVISTIPFSAQPNIVPIAKVVLDASAAIVTCDDARPLMFRLGTGGDTPNRQYMYTWADGRAENVASNATGFIGGDKSLGDQKTWIDAVMTRMWEIGGGEYWYSATADRNVQMVTSGTVFANGDNFEFVTSNLHWRGLTIIFDNSTGYYNNVADQLTSVPGLTDLAVGDCIYVDLIRSSNATVIAQKGTLSTLGAGVNRHVLAYRHTAGIFTKGWKYVIGSFLNPATNASNGIVTLARASTISPSTPIVIGDAGGTITGQAGATGLIINAAASQVGLNVAGGAGASAAIFTSGSGALAATFTGTAGGISVVGGASGVGATITGGTGGLGLTVTSGSNAAGATITAAARSSAGVGQDGATIAASSGLASGGAYNANTGGTGTYVTGGNAAAGGSSGIGAAANGGIGGYFIGGNGAGIGISGAAGGTGLHGIGGAGAGLVQTGGTGVFGIAGTGGTNGGTGVIGAGNGVTVPTNAHNGFGGFFQANSGQTKAVAIPNTQTYGYTAARTFYKWIPAASFQDTHGGQLSYDGTVCASIGNTNASRATNTGFQLSAVTSLDLPAGSTITEVKLIANHNNSNVNFTYFLFSSAISGTMAVPTVVAQESLLVGNGATRYVVTSTAISVAIPDASSATQNALWLNVEAGSNTINAFLYGAIVKYTMTELLPTY